MERRIWFKEVVVSTNLNAIFGAAGNRCLVINCRFNTSIAIISKAQEGSYVLNIRREYLDGEEKDPDGEN